MHILMDEINLYYVGQFHDKSPKNFQIVHHNLSDFALFGIPRRLPMPTVTTQ